jgi:D-amino peptidase
MVGVGDSTISIQPQESLEAIRAKVKSALSGELANCLWSHPNSFAVRIRFNRQQLAYRASHYPGANLMDPKTITFTTKDYDEVMRLILFVV